MSSAESKGSTTSSPVTGELTDLIGDVGLWHYLILAVIFTNSVFNAFGQLAMVFMLPQNVHFRCNVTDHDYFDNTTEIFELTANVSECMMHYPNGTAAGPCRSWHYDHRTYTSTIFEEWNLVCDKDYLKPFPQALSMAGLIIGNVVFSHFSDHYGRKPAVYTGMVLCLVSGIAATATSDFIVFNVGRFVSSVSKIGIQATTVIYLETILPSYRYIFTLTNGYGFHLGMAAVAGTGYFTDSWRYLQGLISGPAIALLPFLYFVWESPRWLLSTKQMDEAEKVLRRISKMNKIDDSVVDKNIVAIKQKYSHLHTQKAKSMLDLFVQPAGKRPKGLHMGAKTLIMWLMCFTSGLLFYTATFETTNLGTQPHLTFCVPIIGELISITLMAVGVRYLRRKLIIFITAALGGVGFIMFNYANLRLYAIILIRSSAAAFAQIYPIYSAELYPTPLRNVGIGFCDLMYRLASTVDPFGRYYLPKIHVLLLPCLYAAMSLLCAVLGLLLPETMDQALDDGVFARLSRRLSHFSASVRRQSTASVSRRTSNSADRGQVNHGAALEENVEKF